MVVGIDEVGRGCWAGPLVAGAVILGSPIDGLTDSKMLSAKKRIMLADQINRTAKAAALGWVSSTEVDQLGLTASVKLAMERALNQIKLPYSKIIIDGNINFLSAMPNTEALIKADLTVESVSAASIIAKVARDSFMAQLPAKYANYNFAKHVGYGTAGHLAELMEYGVCDLHRRSYKPVKALLQ